METTASAADLSRPLATRASGVAETRQAIMAAASELMAERGPEQLTISEVARRARVNRGTAYQHFRTREELISAVREAFAQRLAELLAGGGGVDDRIDRIIEYFVAHPALARLWIYELLSDEPHRSSPAWDAYVSRVDAFAKSGAARQGIDAGMMAFILVAAPLLWSLWSRAGAGGEQAQTARFAREFKRLLLFGALRAESWPELTQALGLDVNQLPDSNHTFKHKSKRDRRSTP